MLLFFQYFALYIFFTHHVVLGIREDVGASLDELKIKLQRYNQRNNVTQHQRHRVIRSPARNNKTSKNEPRRLPQLKEKVVDVLQSGIKNYQCGNSTVCDENCVKMQQYFIKAGTGSNWAKRHPSLTALYREANCSVSVEIGIARGELSHHLLSHVHGIREYHAVDPFLGGYDPHDITSIAIKEMNASGSWRDAILANMSPFGCRFRFHYGFSNVLYKDFPPETVDCLFIDGDHTFEGVKADIQLWTPIVKPGGLYIFDDVKEDMFPGVFKAVNSFCTNNQLNLTMVNKFNNYMIQKAVDRSKVYNFDW